MLAANGSHDGGGSSLGVVRFLFVVVGIDDGVELAPETVGSRGLKELFIGLGKADGKQGIKGLALVCRFPIGSFEFHANGEMETTDVTIRGLVVVRGLVVGDAGELAEDVENVDVILSNAPCNEPFLNQGRQLLNHPRKQRDGKGGSLKRKI